MTVGGLLAVAVVGIFYVIGLFSKTKDGADDRLIGILQETVTALEKKVDDQKKEHDNILGNLTKQIGELTKKVDDLEQENGTLVKVLQGRDEQTQAFYKKAFEAIETGKGTHSLVENLAKNQSELMKVLVDHLKPGTTIINQPNK